MAPISASIMSHCVSQGSPWVPRNASAAPPVASAVQNSISAGDNSLVGGLVSALVLVLLNWAIGYASYRWRPVERILQGQPARIVTDGKIHLGELRRELITLAELHSALRKQGVVRVSDCAEVVLEPNGTLSVIRRDVPQPSAAELAHPSTRSPSDAGT